MYLKQSDATASLQLSSQRKRDLLDHFETNGDELDRWREFNAAYHEDDQQVHAIPDSARQAGAGTGLRPRRSARRAASRPTASASISAPRRSRRPTRRHPDLHFVLGDVEDPADAGRDRGAVRLHRDRRHHRHVRGHRRHVEAGASIVRAVDADHHLLLLPSVGAGPEARRGAGTAEQAAQDQLHRHRRLPAT